MSTIKHQNIYNIKIFIIKRKDLNTKNKVTGGWWWRLKGWNLSLVVRGAAVREIAQLSRVSTLGQNHVKLFRSCSDNLAKTFIYWYIHPAREGACYFIIYKLLLNFNFINNIEQINDYIL